MSTTTVTHIDELATRSLAEVDPLADVVAGTSNELRSTRVPGGLRAPIWRLLVTSDFGERLHPVLGTKRFHRGVDYGARSGTSVRSAADGEVVWAGELGPYGILVVVAHDSHVHTAYGHLESTAVRVGQRVRAGRRIGRVGSTGLATGPHLHFEVRDHGTPVDPSNWLTAVPSASAALVDALDGRVRCVPSWRR